MKVSYFILNRFDYDSRARLEVETIGRMGHHINIIATVGGTSEEYLGFPIHRIRQQTWPSRKVRFIQYNLQAALIGAKLKADVCHAIDLDALAAAYWASRKTGSRMIYEARELYTELEPLAGRGVITGFWRYLEKRLIGKPDRTITINESIADELCRRYGIERPVIIRNVAKTPHRITPVDLHSEFGIPPDYRIVIYQGVLRRGQGILYQLEILKHLEKVTLVFMGDGPLRSEIERKVSDLTIGNNVILAGRVPPDELVNYTASADAGMLLMQGEALNNKLALPQKLFQYLSAGIPQIVSPMPEISAFVEREKTGIVVNLGDPRQAAEVISEFFRDDGRYAAVKENCKKSARKYNWETESTKLVEIYRDLE